MENPQKLTKKEKKELRKIEWQEKAKVEQRNAQIKKYSIWTGAVLIILAVVGGLFWLVNSPTQTQTSVAANIPPVSAKDITSGNPKAKVTLIEYGDFQCPACGEYYPLVKQLLTDENGKIYFVFRNFPLVNAHPNAFVAAQASYAAYNQGKFMEMQDLLYSNQSDWVNLPDPRGTFTDYARKLKLNLSKFQTDLNSDATKKYVQDSEDAALSDGIDATPTFIVNGNKITNPQNYADFKKIIDSQLNKK